jgi:hypothetical protein
MKLNRRTFTAAGKFGLQCQVVDDPMKEGRLMRERLTPA